MDESAKKIADLEWYRRSHANTDEYVDREVAKIRAAHVCFATGHGTACSICHVEVSRGR